MGNYKRMLFNGDAWMALITEAQKIAYLEHHLPYEYSMLKETFNRMHGAADQLHYNSYYESFVVHVRNLLDFLCDKTKTTEIRVTDFGQTRRDKPKEIGRTYGDLHDAVLHLGRTRPAAVEQKISLARCDTVFAWLDPAFEDFVNRLTPDQLRHWNLAG
jgi:hypothetical protein